jgi:glycosyltransferase involved in cell wall biosynthesis
LRVYRNERNLGQYGNKNKALEYARSDFIKYLDGDDLLLPDAVTALMRAWDRGGPGTGIVFGRFLSVDVNGRYVSQPRRWGLQGRCHGPSALEIVTRKRLAASMFGNVTSHLFFRPALQMAGGFPNDNSGPGDIETFLKLLCLSDAIFIEDPVALYRTHAGGMTGKTFGVRECGDYLIMVERLKEFFDLQTTAPPHLREHEFYQEWKVWASTHIILASYQRKLRGLPNQFDDIRNLFNKEGMVKKFDSFVRSKFPTFILRTIASKFRKLVGVPIHPPLFSRQEALHLQKISGIIAHAKHA